MQNTVNLNLKKPDQNDFVNIGDINDNMDILDAEVAKKYVKPLAGIPSLDLDSATQAALKKAETALQSVTKASVGLGNVDNTSDVNKPVSTAQQAALDKKANLASPILTGTPTAPTASESTNTQQIATTAFVDRAVKTHQSDNVSHDTYVTCATAGATAAKVVTAAGFTLTEGARITVKFTIANTATTPTLKINTEVAKAIVKADGTAFKNIKAGVYSFVYDGTNFIVQGEGGEYGTAVAGDVRSTKTFGTENGVVQGTLDLSKLIESNIKSGVTIGGVTGNLDIASLGGKKWAKGTVVVDATTRDYYTIWDPAIPYKMNSAVVNGLTFKPRMISLKRFYKYISGGGITYTVNIVNETIYTFNVNAEADIRNGKASVFRHVTPREDAEGTAQRDTIFNAFYGAPINVHSSGFTLPVYGEGTYYWEAFE